MRMDHYCVWMTNTIGLRNHKYFFLFLVYTAIIIGHWFLFTLLTLRNMLSQGSFENIPLFKTIVLLLFTFTIIPFWFVVFFFVGWHFYLLATNQTSVEHHKNSQMLWKFKRNGIADKYRQIYNAGWVNNVNQVLGKNKWLWFLPIVDESDMDGIHYQTISAGEMDVFHKAIVELFPKNSNPQVKQVIYQGETSTTTLNELTRQTSNNFDTNSHNSYDSRQSLSSTCNNDSNVLLNSVKNEKADLVGHQHDDDDDKLIEIKINQ